jgi:hypothetical protein
VFYVKQAISIRSSSFVILFSQTSKHLRRYKQRRSDNVVKQKNTFKKLLRKCSTVMGGEWCISVPSKAIQLAVDSENNDVRVSQQNGRCNAQPQHQRKKTTVVYNKTGNVRIT